MKKLVGFKRSNFTTKEGVNITGFNLYFTEKVVGEGAGLVASSVYLTDTKIQNFGIDLNKMLNHDVEISYNKWGSIQGIGFIN